MKNCLSIFSEFVSDLHSRVTDGDADDLARWSVGELSEKLGFDAAWYGWVDLRPQFWEIHANSTVNLPEDYFNTWLSMSEQDVLAVRMLGNRGRTATYSRLERTQTDGMVFLSDTYGLKKIATAEHWRVGRTASFYISSYRGGPHARDWTEEEQQFLQCSVDQISKAMELSASEPSRDTGPTDAISIFVNEKGLGILGMENLRKHLDVYWPDWDGDFLPERLRDLIHRPGEHTLADRKLVVRCENGPKFRGLGLRKITLRRLRHYDQLTPREREVARALAMGKSHKHVAEQLGIAPATVRNQIRSIYSKLEIDNKVSLAGMVRDHIGC